MVECFVNRNTKEILASRIFESVEEIVSKDRVYNETYDVITFKDNNIESKITEKDGKTYLNYEYVN